MTIVEFLTARYDEEAAACPIDRHEEDCCTWLRMPCDCIYGDIRADLGVKRATVETCEAWLHEDDRGIDPCAAGVLAIHAQRFVSHPDHDPAWS